MISTVLPEKDLVKQPAMVRQIKRFKKRIDLRRPQSETIKS